VLSPRELWRMFSSSDLLDEMRPEYWDRKQPSEITHIVKEIFRQIAVRNRWGYSFERPNRHDMVVWHNLDHQMEEKPAFVLESENKQDPEEIEKEIKKLVKSNAYLRVGVFYAWPEHDSKAIVTKAKRHILKQRPDREECAFLLILGYTRPSKRPKNLLPQVYGYEAHAIDSHARHVLLGTKQIYPKKTSRSV